MYKLGYLDDDKGNRTSFARQFEKDFDLDVIEDLNEVKTLHDLLEVVEGEGLDALAIDFQLAASGDLSYNGDDVVEYFDKNKSTFLFLWLLLMYQMLLIECMMFISLMIKGKLRTMNIEVN